MNALLKRWSTPLFKATPENPRASLTAEGFNIGEGETLESLAASAHVSPFALVAALSR